MDGDLAMDVVRQAKAMGIQRVRFHGVGESLLHPKLLDVITYADTLDIPELSLSTNAFNLKGDLAAGLRTYANLEFFMSMHWGLQPKFRAKCIENAKAYLASAPRNRRIAVQLLCSQESIGDFQEFYDTFWPLVEQTENACLWLKQPLTWPLDTTPQVGYIPSVPVHPKIELDRTKTPLSLAAGCNMPLRFLMVMADGNCAPCCVGTVTWNLGKMPEQTLQEIWESPRMVDIRRLWAAADDSLLCGHCKKRNDCSTTY